ncbi:hypothetical protein CR513_35257, partial [Mucuna pruriens]
FLLFSLHFLHCLRCWGCLWVFCWWVWLPLPPSLINSSSPAGLWTISSMTDNFLNSNLIIILVLDLDPRASICLGKLPSSLSLWRVILLEPLLLSICHQTVQVTTNLILSFWATPLVSLTQSKRTCM